MSSAGAAIAHDSAPGLAPAATGTEWPRLVLGLAVAYAVFLGSAAVLGSDRGQAGVVVAALVLATVLAAERLLFGQPPRRAARALGLGLPHSRGMTAAAGVCLLILLVLPVFAMARGEPLRVDGRWAALLPGLFAQAGVAEEALFRGFLFRRVRQGRRFWRAVVVASLPFVAVHLVLFLTLPWPVATAALLLSALLSVPLAWLFELGGGTIWAPALVHFVVQGAIKLVSVQGAETLLPLVWMAASATLPWLVFLLPRPPSASISGTGIPAPAGVAPGA